MLKNYENHILTIRKMGNYDLQYEYIKVKSQYEYRKNFFNSLIIGILLLFFSGYFHYFAFIISKNIKITLSTLVYTNSALNVGIISIGLLIITFISSIIFLIYLSSKYLKESNDIYSYLLILEEEKNQRTNNRNSLARNKRKKNRN